MADILKKIEAYKREEIAAAKARLPLPSCAQRANDATCPARLCRRACAGPATPAASRLIAEIKKASPSKGLIRADFDPPALARAYEEGGAACLSVLTDTPSFQGAPEFLDGRARGDRPAGAAQGFHVRSLSGARGPKLGRRRVLSSWPACPDADARALEDEALALGMDVLVEVHDEAELERALQGFPRR